MGLRERGLHGLREPAAHPLLHDQTIDHDADVVADVLVQLRKLLVQCVLSPVDLYPGEALLADVLEDVLVPALLPADDGRLDHEADVGLQPHHLIDDLLLALPFDGPPADPAVGMAYPRKKQAQVVVDLRHGAHRGARIARGRLLVDGYGRRQSLDGVDVRLVHLPQELAGVGGQAFDIAALAFGVDGVEGETRFARAGQTGDDYERVAREGKRDVLEVVLPGPRDDDAISAHYIGILAGGQCPGRRRRGWRPGLTQTRRAAPSVP